MLCKCGREKTMSKGRGAARGCARCHAKARKQRLRAALGKASPPVGFMPVAVTSGADGEVHSVRSVPDGEHDHKPIVLPDHSVRFVTSLLDSAGNIKLQYVRGERAQDDRYAAALAAVDRHFDDLEARVTRTGASVPLQSPAEHEGELQVTLLMGDPHIGMLSWHLETGADFDLRIAERELCAAVDMLVARSPAAARLVVANLGDFFHAEDESQRTPRSGHKLDVDGRAGKILDIGFAAFERIVLAGLARYSEVVIVNLPGNHDPRLARVLERWLRARFRDEPRVACVAADDPYVFVSWGECLAMYHHGDGAKPDQLPAIMAAHSDGALWGAHRHREIWTGHIHHLQRREFPGVVWESCRTMAPADYWTHHSGYRAGRGMRTVTHHKAHGRVREDWVSATEVQIALARLGEPG